MEHSLSCVVINPGDIGSYESTVKQALLYYDKIHLIPALELFHTGIVSMQTQIGAASSAAMPDIMNDMIDIQKKIISRARSKRKTPPRRGLKKAIDKKSSKVVKRRFSQQIKLEDVRRGLVAMAETGVDQTRRVEQQLAPAIQEGFVTVLAEDKIVEPLKEVLWKAFAAEWKKLLAAAGVQLFGGPTLPLGGAEDVLCRYSGEQAASMTSFYDCPLMTSSTHFMQSLTQNLNDVPPAKWLSPDVALRQWKNSKLSLTVSDAELPSPEQLDVEDILEVRRVVGDELGFYRLKLAEFADKLRNAPWDDSFEKEASSMLETEVRPAIEQARAALLKDPPLPYRLKKAYEAAKNEKKRIQQVVELLPIPEPIIAWSAFVAGVDEFIAQKYLYQPDKSVKNGMLFMVKARTILQ